MNANLVLGQIGSPVDGFVALDAMSHRHFRLSLQVKKKDRRKILIPARNEIR